MLSLTGCVYTQNTGQKRKRLQSSHLGGHFGRNTWRPNLTGWWMLTQYVQFGAHCLPPSRLKHCGLGVSRVHFGQGWAGCVWVGSSENSEKYDEDLIFCCVSKASEVVENRLVLHYVLCLCPSCCAYTLKKNIPQPTISCFGPAGGQKCRRWRFPSPQISTLCSSRGQTCTFQGIWVRVRLTYFGL